MIYTLTLNPARDRSVIIDDFGAGKVNRIKSIKDDPGGKGINVSKLVNELGGQTSAVAVLGGNTGKYIENALKEMGLQGRFVYTNGETRTNIKVSDPVNHTTTDINEPGAPLGNEEAAAVRGLMLSLLMPGDSLVIAGKIDILRIPLGEWIAAFSQKGAKVFLDTEGAALSEGIKAGVYMIKPNDDELAQLTGNRFEGEEQLISEVRKLLCENSVQLAVVSMGSNGALLITRDAALKASAPKVEAVCTTGAGDSLTGAFVYALDEGKPLDYALRLGVAAGSAAVTMPGTQVPSRSLIYSLLEETQIWDAEKLTKNNG